MTNPAFRAIGAATGGFNDQWRPRSLILFWGGGLGRGTSEAAKLGTGIAILDGPKAGI